MSKREKKIDIFYGLLKRGLTEEYAFIFVQSLDSRVKNVIEHFDTNIIFGYILITLGFIIVSLYLLQYFEGIYILYGLLLIIGGIWCAVRNTNRKKKYQEILKILESDELILKNSDPIKNIHLN